MTRTLKVFAWWVSHRTYRQVRPLKGAVWTDPETGTTYRTRKWPLREALAESRFWAERFPG